MLARSIGDSGSLAILGSVYPHGEYTSLHADTLQQVESKMSGWGHPYIDFCLQLPTGWGIGFLEYHVTLATQILRGTD